MKLFYMLVVFCVSATCSYGQGKGVDQQNDRIRDNGSARQPANNGAKQNTGSGRGVDFGSGRTQISEELPNPYRFAVRRDAVTQAVEELMREHKLNLDVSASKLDEGLLVSQPYVFSKGFVVSQTDLNRYALNVNGIANRSWTRARYTIVFDAQSIDGLTTNLTVTARIQGRVEEASGAAWIDLRSSGLIEQQLLSALAAKVEESSSASPKNSLPGSQPH